jgi:hypothetical protein
MGNDHILSLRTGDGLVQRRAPAIRIVLQLPGTQSAPSGERGRDGRPVLTLPYY